MGKLEKVGAFSLNVDSSISGTISTGGAVCCMGLMRGPLNLVSGRSNEVPAGGGGTGRGG